MNDTAEKQPQRPIGWMIALAIALLFVSVIAGVVMVGLAEKRKQDRYRLRGIEAPALPQTNSAVAVSRA
jgi:hypothetical protein